MKAIICDIDGVIANHDQRTHHLEGKKDYNKFYAEIPFDTPILTTVELLQVFKETHFIILLTARPDTYFDTTVAWLETHKVPYDWIFMRQAGDYRPDYIVKREIFEHHLREQWEITAVFEDRTRCVEMWRALGLACWQNVFWDEQKPDGWNEKESQNV